MKKRRILVLTLTILLAFSFTFASAALAAEPPPIGVTVDGERVVFEDQQPVIVDGRTLVPVRGVFEFVGFEVDWDPDARQATLTSDDYEVIITVGSATFTTNGTNNTLDVPAQIIGGRTLLPIRAVLESVGYNVYWDNANRTVIVLSMSAMELLLKSNNAMAEVISYDRITEIGTIIEVENAAMSMLVTVESNVHLDPIAIRTATSVVIDIDGVATGEANSASYLIREGENLVMYMYIDGEWTKEVSPVSQEFLDELRQMSTDDAFNEFLTSAVVVGSARIGNVDTWIVVYETDIAATMGLLGGLQGTGFDELFQADLLDTTDNVTATLWIAKDSFYQVKLHVDMTEMMAEVDPTVVAYYMTITSSNFNNARPVVLPAGAAGAVEI